METLTIQELQSRLELIGDDFALTANDTVNNKGALTTMIITDKKLDIDEIIDFETAPMSIGFRIIKKGGRVNKQTGSRTGTIKMALWVEFTFRKFADGGFQTSVNISF